MTKVQSISAVAILLVAATSPVLAQAPTSAGAQPAQTTADAANVPVKGPVDTSYVLGPGDVVEVGLVGRGDFSQRARVGADGTILLQYIGKIQASQRTVLELADDIRNALISGGFFKEAVVRAEVVGISSRYVTVLGFVGSPGLVTLDKTYHLSEILARVGGRSPSGANYILLTRAADGKSEKYMVSDLAAGGPEKDPVVANGDKIFIPSIENEVAYLSGAVKSPGTVPLTPNMTVRMAIAKSGGVTEDGNENKITIVRAGVKVKNVKIDDVIQPGDIITIGERLF